MFDLDITELFNAIESGDDRVTTYCDSVANSERPNIAEITWNNAKASPYQLLTPENKQDVIDHFKDYGAWDDLDEWGDTDLNGLLVQEVVSNMSDYLHEDDWGWAEYEKQAEAGQLSGRLFTHEGKVYFSVGG